MKRPSRTKLLLICEDYLVEWLVVCRLHGITEYSNLKVANETISRAAYTAAAVELAKARLLYLRDVNRELKRFIS